MAECFVDGGRGGGAKFATGTITPDVYIEIRPDTPYTVSGLPFEPTHVVVVVHPKANGTLAGMSDNILVTNTDAPKAIRGTISNGINASQGSNIAFLSDGFRFEGYGSLQAGYTYQWIIWAD